MPTGRTRLILPLVTGAALVAALVFNVWALIETRTIARAPIGGIRAEALVVGRDLHPEGGSAFSTVTLMFSDPRLPETMEVPHPPASLAEIWIGARLPVLVEGIEPPQVAFLPEAARSRRRIALILLALACAVAAVSGVTARVLRA